MFARAVFTRRQPPVCVLWRRHRGELYIYGIILVFFLWIIFFKFMMYFFFLCACFVMYSTSVRFASVKSPDVSLCGWLAFNKWINKYIKILGQNEHSTWAEVNHGYLLLFPRPRPCVDCRHVIVCVHCECPRIGLRLSALNCLIKIQRHISPLIIIIIIIYLFIYVLKAYSPVNRTAKGPPQAHGYLPAWGH